MIHKSYASQNAGGHSFLHQNKTYYAHRLPKIHWYACGADGRRVVGVRSRDYQIFWDGYITLAMGLRPRARVELRYQAQLFGEFDAWTKLK